MGRKKLKIAVTGNIGSGKSAFTKFISEAGYKVINADELSKEILAGDKKAREEVQAAFGKEAYKGGKPDRKYLAEEVFTDPIKLQKLESILHPVVISRSMTLMEEQLKNQDAVFLEAALIYEADMEDLFDHVVLITADKQKRFERKRLSENYTKEQFEKREETQIPEEEKKKRADFIFENNSDLESLKKKAGLLFILLQLKAQPGI